MTVCLCEHFFAQLLYIVNNPPLCLLMFTQEAALQGNLIAICLEQLDDPHDLLRQWLALCLGKMWCFFDAARWCGVRDSAHEKLYKLLTDENPEVMSRSRCWNHGKGQSS